MQIAINYTIKYWRPPATAILRVSITSGSAIAMRKNALLLIKFLILLLVQISMKKGHKIFITPFLFVNQFD